MSLKELQHDSNLKQQIKHIICSVKIDQDTKEKVLGDYENLLTSWERETMESLQTKAIILLGNFVSGDSDILPYSPKTFKEYYKDKVKNAPQNEKINTFEYDVKRDLEQYVDQIKRFSRDFKAYY